MSINAEGHFNNLQSYLNMSFYSVPIGIGEVVLKEKIFTQTGDTTHQVKLQFSGKLFAIKLDKEKSKGKSEPLFHFLDNTGRPWSKRCDFVLFNFFKNQIRVHCFEFKHGSLPVDNIVEQLNSSEAWLRSLNNTIKNYTNKCASIHVAKYVLSAHESPANYLDNTGCYLKKDSAIRHYNYSDINGMKLQELDNCSKTIIK